MIQILGLRKYLRHGKTHMKEAFFSAGWRLPNIEAVFDPDARATVLELVPADQKYNLYFTVAECFEESGRKLKEQWAVPFDVDHLDLPEDADPHLVAEQVARTVCEALGVDYNKTGVVFSGHGVQLFIRTFDPIIDEEYFDRYRQHYGLLCDRVQRLLNERGLTGEMDRSVWSKARLMRFPDTMNVKEGKIQRMARVIQPVLEPQLFTVPNASGLDTTTGVDEVLHTEELSLYPRPDTRSVLDECLFLKWCADNPQEVREPQWYAMTSITARLEDGRTLTHKMSEGHPGYSHYETENKVDQSLASAGPRTCKNIGALWDGCKECPHYGKIKSPILIKGPDFIASKDAGFREIRITEQGPKPGKPAYLDIVKEFKRLHPYKTLRDSDEVVVYNGKYWEYRNKRDISVWLNSIVRPEPTTQEKAEAIEAIKSYELSNLDLMRTQRNGLLNFQNCVVNAMTLETYPHSPQYGFFEILPYSYDPRATSPLWVKFLNDICEGDEAKIQTIREFAGYCISGDEYWLHKCLILLGEGSNGKSVLMETMGEVVGEANYSAVPIQDMERPTARVRMMHKLFNYSEETAPTALRNSSVFKTLTTGGQIFMRQLYAQEFMMRNTTKLIASTNEMPQTDDLSHGLMRRLLIVPLNRRFAYGEPGFDPHIKNKLKAELPGICNDLLRAYQDLKRRGSLPESTFALSAKTMEEFSRANNEVIRFYEECVLPDEESSVSKEDMMSEYLHWCEANGIRYPKNDVWFFRALYRSFPILEQVQSTGGRRRIRGCRLRREEY